MSTTELDPAAILAALGVHDSTSIRPVSGGWDTAIWRVERDGQSYALRVFRPEQQLVAQREVVAMRTTASGGIPVPAVHAEGLWEDRPALLLSWLPGRPLFEELKVRPWRVWPLAIGLGRMQAEIHNVPPPPELKGTFEHWITLIGPDEIPLQECVREASREQSALLHLDYHPLNVMVTSSQISGVLDWANAAVGDPRADIARTDAILRLSPIKPINLAVKLFRLMLLRGWERGYTRVSGPLTGLGPFHAWASAIMIADLAPKIGRPGINLREEDLEPIRRSAEKWKQQLGLTSG